MKPLFLLPALALIALALPVVAQSQSQPFDHHNLPLDSPTPSRASKTAFRAWSRLKALAANRSRPCQIQ